MNVRLLAFHLKNMLGMNNLRQWDEFPSFVPWEFDSPDLKDSGLGMDINFIRNLQLLRNFCGFALTINSGYRTQAWNDMLDNSVPNSAHLSGLAVDIHITASRPRDRFFEGIYTLHDENGVRLFRRIGLARTFVHLDVDMSKPSEVFYLY